MDNELQQKLQQRFPMLYRDIGRPDTCMEWGICCGDGWFGLIWSLSEDLEKLNSNLVARQVKEKFGTLRFRIGESYPGDEAPHPAWSKDEMVLERIREAEDASGRICEQCGLPKGACSHER